MIRSSVARVKFIKTKVILSYQRCLKPSMIIFGSRNQRLFMFKFQYQSGKNEKVGKIFWITKRSNKGLQIGTGFRDYKLGQEGLQIG